MFNFAISLVVREDAMTEIKHLQKEIQDAEERRLREVNFTRKMCQFVGEIFDSDEMKSIFYIVCFLPSLLLFFYGLVEMEIGQH